VGGLGAGGLGRILLVSAWGRMVRLRQVGVAMVTEELPSL